MSSGWRGRERGLGLTLLLKAEGAGSFLVSTAAALTQTNLRIIKAAKLLKQRQGFLLAGGPCNARNFKNGLIVDQSINSGFAGSPEELTVLVALSVQCGSLTISVLEGSAALESVTVQR